MSFASVTASGCGDSVDPCAARGVRINAGSQPVAASNCSAASAMYCFFICAIRSAVSSLAGFKNTRLGDAAQIGPHRRPPVAGHVERDGFRQFVRRCLGALLPLSRQLDCIHGQSNAVGEHGHPAVMIQFSHKGPQIGNVAGHLPCPIGMTFRPRAASRGVPRCRPHAPPSRS